MAFDEEDIRKEDREPGPDVTRKLYHQWRTARRGNAAAEDMTNPVWLWLFRGRIDPYHASERFKSRLGKMIGSVDYPSEPRWAGCRMGQSRTLLADGREFWIAGEHEDYYDPDFYIYNDVIVRQPDGELRIYGYPASMFRPTDFHSATAIEEESKILIVGNVGYADERDVGSTQVYVLDTQTLAIKTVETSGNSPGWISKHDAELSDDGSRINIRGGEVMTADGFLENIDDWSLSLVDSAWTRRTKREWIRFQVSRADEQGLHLWQYGMRKFAIEYPQAGLDQEDDLMEAIGAEPDMDSFDALYTPPLEHSAVEGDPEADVDWKTKRILVDGICVRYTDDMENLTVTVEGDLPTSSIEVIAENLQSKLSLVENAVCQIKWIS